MPETGCAVSSRDALARSHGIYHEYLRVSLYMTTLTAMHVRHSRVQLIEYQAAKTPINKTREAQERYQGSSDIIVAFR